MINMKMRRNIQLSYIFLSGVNELSSVSSSIQYLHTTDADMGGGIFYILYSVYCIYFSNIETLIHSLISILYSKVPFLIVRQRNPMRID